MLVRIRKDDPDPQEAKSFSNLIIVKWDFDPAENGGVPGVAELDLMRELEEVLFGVFDEKSPIGCSFAVFTRPGTREWRFYTVDAQQFIEGFNTALQGRRAYPIALEAFADPEWSAYAELRPRMEE